MIPRTKVAVTFYVRKAPDRDRVTQFVELYRNGAQMAPIVVNKNMELIDGRHRLEAQKELHRRMIPVIIEDIQQCELMFSNFETVLS
jgi:ParB-like chromosome segregation protein Spo0J